MSITGVETAIFAVANLKKHKRFWTDYGLRSRIGEEATFEAENGSAIQCIPTEDPLCPKSNFPGCGMRQVIWGVDSPSALAMLAEKIARIAPVEAYPDGMLRSSDPDGASVGLRVWVLIIGDAANTPTPHLAMGADMAIEDAIVLG